MNYLCYKIFDSGWISAHILGAHCWNKYNNVMLWYYLLAGLGGNENVHTLPYDLTFCHYTANRAMQLCNDGDWSFQWN